ncbi:MAG TPA: serine hydrolase domain-containing protein [Acidimicrobiia bacterium]|nr:serine hydrolase domain-containing protein [Acidimicrobiia bacterium]
MTPRRCVPAVVLALGLLASACSSGGAASDTSRPRSTAPSTTAPVPMAVPGATWQKVTPASVGLSATALGQIAQTAHVGKSRCLVVARRGTIAGEWYFDGTGPDTTQNVFSATKSIASTLIGIAQDEGDLRVTDRVSKYVPEWRNTPSSDVTIRDILSGVSGRQWSPLIDYRQLVRAKNADAFAVGLHQAAAPGTVWDYNNSADQVLDEVLRHATHENVVQFAHVKLFAPIGMDHTHLTTDPSGNALLYEGMQSSCEDMARLGLLFLDRGRWGTHQIVSSAWVDAATGASSSRLNAAYGYLWWLNRPGRLKGPLSATNVAAAAKPETEDGSLVPGLPATTYWALGLGNQLVQVDPGSGTIVVRLGTPEPQPKPPTFGPKEASRVVTEAVQ